MEYMTTKEAAEKWGIKVRRVQALCEKGQVESVSRFGQIWAIPKDTPKPIDGRTKEGKASKHDHNAE